MMNEGQEQEAIQVQALYKSDGTPPVPLRMWWDDLPFKVIVRHVEPASMRRAGGVGVRYTCIIDSQQRVLCYIDTEELTQWFIELVPPADGNPVREIIRVERIYDHPGKAYVKVMAMCYPDGRPPKPLEMWWIDETRFQIDSPKCEGHRASQEAGGIGLRYRCYIRGHQKVIFFEKHTLRWFVAKKQSDVQTV